MGTRVMPVSELRSKTSEVLDELRDQGKEVYVTRYGHPVAVLVDYEHYERLKALSQRIETTEAPAHPRPGAQYPTVANPPSSLKSWLNLIPEGYEGDALADTEALYDEERLEEPYTENDARWDKLLASQEGQCVLDKLADEALKEIHNQFILTRKFPKMDGGDNDVACY